MNREELNLILNEGEGYFVEFKESLSRIDKEIVAFSNSSGGRIFLGITDKSQIKGITLNNKQKSEIQSIAENCDPPIRILILKFDNIAIIHIPEGNRKPYRCSSGFYLRTGANSQKMNTDDIVAFLQNEGRIMFDGIIDERFKFEEDFDTGKYDTFIRKSNIDKQYNTIDVLLNLGLLVRESNKIRMNNTGILFFAKNPQSFFHHSVVTGVLYKGSEKLNILDRKDFTGDIISNVEDAVLFLKKHLNLEYMINNLQREEILEIPETALREAIVNSVVHRDYFEKGANVIVEIYDDRVEISNPGGLPKGLKESEFGSKSVARNPLIASLMQRTNYIEKLGTGIRRIQHSLEKAEMPPAVFEIGKFFTIIFKRKIKGIIPADGSEKFGEKFAQKFAQKFALKGKRLSRIIKLLEMIDRNEFVSGHETALQFKISDRMIDKDIALLKSIGFIEFSGHRKYGTYSSTGFLSEFISE